MKSIILSIFITFVVSQTLEIEEKLEEMMAKLDVLQKMFVAQVEVNTKLELGISKLLKRSCEESDPQTDEKQSTNERRKLITINDLNINSNLDIGQAFNAQMLNVNGPFTADSLTVDGSFQAESLNLDEAFTADALNLNKFDSQQLNIANDFTTGNLLVSNTLATGNMTISDALESRQLLTTDLIVKDSFTTRQLIIEDKFTTNNLQVEDKFSTGSLIIRDSIGLYGFTIDFTMLSLLVGVIAVCICPLQVCASGIIIANRCCKSERATKFVIPSSAGMGNIQWSNNSHFKANTTTDSPYELGL